jgi:replicative DNA helicase
VLARVLEGRVSWDAAVDQFPSLARARATVESAADDLHLLCGASTDLQQLGDLAEQYGDGPKVIVIDYLQKVASHSHEHDVDAVTRDAKGLALTTGAAVVAISSMDQVGIEAQRLRMSHLRGAEALSYEADLVVMLDSKLNTVSKLHTQFDDLKRREFAEWSVLSVEKNRRGPAGLGLEFRRDLAFSRFDPQGGIVSERLEESMGVQI